MKWSSMFNYHEYNIGPGDHHQTILALTIWASIAFMKSHRAKIVVISQI